MMDFPLSTRTRVDNDSKDVRDQSFLLVTKSNWDACAGERVGPLRPVRFFDSGSTSKTQDLSCPS